MSVNAQTTDTGVLLEIVDENGEEITFPLPRASAQELVLCVARALAAMPQNKSLPSLEARPEQVAVGVGPDGQLALLFRFARFPEMTFVFEEAVASQMSKQINEVLSTPSNMRSQPQKH